MIHGGCAHRGIRTNAQSSFTNSPSFIKHPFTMSHRPVARKLFKHKNAPIRKSKPAGTSVTFAEPRTANIDTFVPDYEMSDEEPDNDVSPTLVVVPPGAQKKAQEASQPEEDSDVDELPAKKKAARPAVQQKDLSRSTPMPMSDSEQKEALRKLAEAKDANTSTDSSTRSSMVGDSIAERAKFLAKLNAAMPKKSKKSSRGAKGKHDKSSESSSSSIKGAARNLPKRFKALRKYSIMQNWKGPSIRRLCRKAGACRISKNALTIAAYVLQAEMRCGLHAAVTYMEHCRRVTLTTADVVHGFKCRFGQTLLI